MARMLGVTGRDGGGWMLGGSRGRPRKLKRRVERRREQQEFRRSLLSETVLPPVPGQRDCRHGCDGECVDAPGPDPCGMTCHPGRLDLGSVGNRP